MSSDKGRQQHIIEEMNRRFDVMLKAMLDVEQHDGHQGVFLVIRVWLNKPLRGNTWFRRRKP